jgi:hypothetical protein
MIEDQERRFFSTVVAPTRHLYVLGRDLVVDGPHGDRYLEHVLEDRRIGGSAGGEEANGNQT